MKQLLSFLILCVVVVTTNGQETISQFQFHGFSGDLKYAVLEDYNEGNEGMGRTVFVFVDVDKNSYANKKFVYPPDESEESMTLENVRKTGRKNAQPIFTRLDVTGTKTGTSVNPETFTWKGVNYKINITSFDEELTEYNSLMAKMDLSITYNGKTQTLQKDKTIPQSRGAASNYAVAAVYVIENKIAVVIEYSVGPGFEGQPDKYHMLVTGVLN